MTRLTVTNAAAQLAKQRINQSYEQQTAGDIIRDLTSTASVDTDSIEDGITFPFYILDDRRTAYHHIANLAQKSGYLAYITPENKLNFTPFNAGQPVQTFTYGTDVLSLTVTESTPGISRVITIGEGAAGSQGQSAWNWLIKDPSAVQGSSGDGDPNRELPDASLRSQDAAQQAADGKAIASIQLTLTGSLLVPGAPLVVVGSAIEVTDAPQDVLNGLFLVRTIRHRFSKRDGFTTQIGFSKAGDSSSGGLGSLGGLL
jgi:phage protein D